MSLRNRSPASRSRSTSAGRSLTTSWKRFQPPALGWRPSGMARPAELSDTSVTSVRVVYADLHGVARGKDVPIGEFDRVADHGLAFCSAIMGTDLRHTPVVGGEQGYPDLVAKPDLTTMTLLPWEPGVACCIADLHPVDGTHDMPADPRGAVRRAVAGFEELGLAEIVSFTVPANVRSTRVMEKLGMRRSPAEDFDHPRLPEGHRLRRHVLYRLSAQQWRRR